MTFLGQACLPSEILARAGGPPDHAAERGEEKVKALQILFLASRPASQPSTRTRAAAIFSAPPPQCFCSVCVFQLSIQTGRQAAIPRSKSRILFF